MQQHVQDGLVLFFLSSFIILWSLRTKTLNSKKSRGAKLFKSVNMSGKVRKSAETILPLAVAL